MTRAAAFVLGCCVLALGPATGQDKPAPLPQDRFVGEWVNTDKDSRGIERLVIAKKDNAWTIEKWYDYSSGRIKLYLLGDNSSAKELPYGFATEPDAVGWNHLSLKLDKNELVVEFFRIYSSDAAPRGRANFRKVERFKKK